MLSLAPTPFAALRDVPPSLKFVQVIFAYQHAQLQTRRASPAAKRLLETSTTPHRILYGALRNGKSHQRSLATVRTPSKQVTTPTLARITASGSRRTVNVATGTDNIAPAVSGAASSQSIRPYISM